MPDCIAAGNAEGALVRCDCVRANFDPRRPIARPVIAPLRAHRVSALALVGRNGQGELDRLDPLEPLVIEFDTLGDEAHAAQLAELVATLHRRGFIVHGSFTLGYDHDDEGCFARLVTWIEAHGLSAVELRLWTPIPGSNEARALAGTGRLRHLDYARWDGAHVIVEPAAMAPETLQRGWAWALRRLGSLRSIIRRRRRGHQGMRNVLAALALSWRPPTSSCADAPARSAGWPWAPTARRSVA